LGGETEEKRRGKNLTDEGKKETTVWFIPKIGKVIRGSKGKGSLLILLNEEEKVQLFS